MSASFKPGTSVSYTFKEPYELARNSSSAVPSSIYSDVTLKGENVSLSFRTHQSPAVLFYVSSYYREYLALLINKHGEDADRPGGMFYTSIFIYSNVQFYFTCASRKYKNI